MRLRLVLPNMFHLLLWSTAGTLAKCRKFPNRYTVRRRKEKLCWILILYACNFDEQSSATCLSWTDLLGLSEALVSMVVSVSYPYCLSSWTKVSQRTWRCSVQVSKAFEFWLRESNLCMKFCSILKREWWSCLNRVGVNQRCHTALNSGPVFRFTRDNCWSIQGSNLQANPSKAQECH